VRGVGAVIAALEADEAPTAIRGGEPTPERSGDGPGCGEEEPVDDTVYRPDRRPARPAPASARRRWPFVLAGVAVVAILAVALWPRDDGGVELVDRPTGLTEIRDLEWPIGEVGDCLRQTGDVLETVACDVPHDLQRFAVGTLDAAAYPPDSAYDDAAVASAIESFCDAAFVSFVGDGPDRSGFEVAYTAPSAGTWMEGDRMFQCLLGVAGRRIVGDASAP
jgi:hypothetical protein